MLYRTILIAVLCVGLSGCTWFGKHPKQAEVWPVYRIPAKPSLNLPTKITPGENPDLDMTIKSLYDAVSYCESILIIVETHNQAAEAHNTRVEEELGIRSEIK